MEREWIQVQKEKETTRKASMPDLQKAPGEKNFWDQKLTANLPNVLSNYILCNF